MTRGSITKGVEKLLFNYRWLVLLIFAGLTVWMGYNALKLRVDAGFEKLLPLEHPYIQTLKQYEKDFGSGNQLIVALLQEEGNIFNPEFFEAMRLATDEVFFLPGVARSTVTSIFTPNVRYIEVVEDGFRGGNVVPAEFQPTPEWMPVVRNNIIKSGRVGSLVANDFSGALIRAELIERDPTTREPLDYQKVATDLEAKIRDRFETDDIKVRIIGFAKSTGDIADGARDVIGFFGIAFAITAVLLFLYSGSIKLTVMPLVVSLVAVIWQLGLLPMLGFGLDPMSILVPFLVFAIGVSHGVQMISGWMGEVLYGGQRDEHGLEVVPAPAHPAGVDSLEAARRTFQRLIIPGSLALASDVLGFVTVLLIDIGIIQEMAITASLGVGAIIFTNLLLLPVLLSFVKLSNLEGYRARRQAAEAKRDGLWRAMAGLTRTGPSLAILAVGATLAVVGFIKSQDLKIGDLHAGVPELREDARYNVDSREIAQSFSIGVDRLSVIVESVENACVHHDVMKEMERFGWYLRNLSGVQSVNSLVDRMKVVLTANNEGNPQWAEMPRDQYNYSSTLYHMGRASDLMNADCTAMPVDIFTVDHKAETIDRIIQGIEAFESRLPEERFNPRLAAGNVGVIAATNQTVSAAQLPIMLWVYGAIVIMCLITFRSIGGTLCVIIPLALVSLLCYALMAVMEIGLKVNTLPVVALGVGIGVDYGIYIYSRMAHFMHGGDELAEAFYKAMRTTGKPVMFTGMTLGVGVATWIFASLQFQADMGILLTFMFVLNMLGAILMLPALGRWLLPRKMREEG